MSKFFKDNKIGQAHRGSTICSLPKNFQVLIIPNCLPLQLNKCSDHQINWEQTDFGTK